MERTKFTEYSCCFRHCQSIYREMPCHLALQKYVSFFGRVHFVLVHVSPHSQSALLQSFRHLNARLVRLLPTQTKSNACLCECMWGVLPPSQVHCSRFGSFRLLLAEIECLLGLLIIHSCVFLIVIVFINLLMIQGVACCVFCLLVSTSQHFSWTYKIRRSTSRGSSGIIFDRLIT